MQRFNPFKRTPLIMMFAVFFTSIMMGTRSPVFKKLPNGLEVILIENHSSPVVASFFVVKVGLRSEEEASCGISHMLEHLLFNGTEHRTQKQLYDDVDMLGVYNNAFTRDDFTCFMMVSPRENFPEAIAIQEDMVFHSTLPPKKLEKERGIVLEELAKDMTSSSYVVESRFKKWLFEGTPYAMPVLGTKESIKKMPREAIWKYYKSHYVPNNTSLLIVGDINAGEILKMIEKRMGKYSSVKLAPPKKINNIFERSKRSKNIRVPIRTSELVFTYPAPPMSANNYPAFELSRLWIEDEDVSPLAGLKQKYGITSIDGEYQSNRDFSLYNITFSFGNTHPVARQKIDQIKEALKRIGNIKLTPSLLKAYKVSRTVEEIYDFENTHYLGMFKGEILADVPFDKVKRHFPPLLIKLIEGVKVSDIEKEMSKLLGYPDPIITLLIPEKKSKPKRMSGHMGGMR